MMQADYIDDDKDENEFQEDQEGASLDRPHIPVLAKEVLSLLEGKQLHYVLDGTLGAGGHAELILTAHPEIQEYIGIDQDTIALGLARDRLAPFQGKVSYHHTNFSELPSNIPALLDAALLDIGVSSMQLDNPERGFSFMNDGPLDMRMNQSDEMLMTAEDIVNSSPQKELEDIFYYFGEEHLSRPIAKMICEKRRKERFTTTLQLAQAIEKLIPRRGKTHPATKVFQALRVAVNQEFRVLEKALQELSLKLNPNGGRLLVITFHSLEDRIVKQAFQKMAKEGLKEAEFMLPFKKPLEADRDEIRTNRRSRSAKLRVIERVS